MLTMSFAPISIHWRNNVSVCIIGRSYTCTIYIYIYIYIYMIGVWYCVSKCECMRGKKTNRGSGTNIDIERDRHNDGDSLQDVPRTRHVLTKRLTIVSLLVRYWNMLGKCVCSFISYYNKDTWQYKGNICIWLSQSKRFYFWLCLWQKDTSTCLHAM